MDKDCMIGNINFDYYLVIKPNGCLQWWDKRKNDWWSVEFEATKDRIEAWKEHNKITWHFEEPEIFVENGLL